MTATHTSHFNISLGPKANAERPFQSGHRGHLPATDAGEKVVHGRSTDASLEGDTADRAAGERVGESLSDAMCVHDLDRGFGCEATGGPGTGLDEVARRRAGHGDDATTAVHAGRGWEPRDTPMAVCAPGVGISRQSGTQEGGAVEVLLAHKVSSREARRPSRFVAAQRDRASALICRAAAEGVTGGRLMELYRAMTDGLPAVHRDASVRASAVSAAARYMLTAPTGIVWGLVDGELVAPAKLGITSHVDAVVWQSCDSWLVDVISVALRRGQLHDDLTRGRVTRVVAAAEAFLEPGQSAEVRVWTHQAPRALAAASIRRPAEAGTAVESVLLLGAVA